MNLQATLDIRELTAEELDHISGGLFMDYGQTQGAGFVALGAMVGVVICGILDWLFD